MPDNTNGPTYFLQRFTGRNFIALFALIIGVFILIPFTLTNRTPDTEQNSAGQVVESTSTPTATPVARVSQNTQTPTPESPASISHTLQLPADYNLQGITISPRPGKNSSEQVWEIVLNFVEPADRAAADEEYSVKWRVEDEDGRLVGQKVLNLGDSNQQWTIDEPFQLSATISDGKNSRAAIPVEGVAVFIASPTPTFTPTPTPSPTPSPTPTFTPSPTPTRTPVPTNTPAAQPRPVQQQQTGPVPPSVPQLDIPFGYGIQADPRGNTAANINHIKTLGFNWVKFQMAWKDVESEPGTYNWAMWDEIINAYSANGIQILLSIPKAPDWARPFDDDKSVEGPPEDPNLYAQFVALVADRYRGRVQAIEIWNEQNLWYEAGGRGRINAANYVQLLQLSYQTIKEVNPQMIVVSGALTPAGNVGDAAVDDIEYLQQMYNNGAKGFFDALGAHPSGYNCPATADWRSVQDPTATSFRGTFENRHHSWCFRGTMEGYRAVMEANGDGNKPIVPTEFGWAVSGNPQPGYEYARDNTPEEQAKWIVEAYQLANKWGWVGPMFLWNLDYGVTAPNTELANFGIIDTPAYDQLAGMPK